MSTNEKNCIILRGLPGSGKSTFADFILASNPGAVHVEADHYVYDENGNYDWKFENLRDYHSKAQSCFDNALNEGVGTIVVSNVSSTWKDFKYYFNKAKEQGYKVTSIIVENRNETKSIHGVPEETLNNMRSKFQVQL